MPRKTIDCRSMPSDRNCSVTISGDEDEVLRLAVAHSVATHGHTDDADLRDALRAVMRDEGDLPLAAGAFLQLIEFHTGHPERFQALAEEWRERIGTDATAQWAVVAADRDRRTPTSNWSPSRTSRRPCGTPSTRSPATSRRSCRRPPTARRVSATSTSGR